MKRAALGFRMHSGWGVLVAVSADAGAIEVVDRRRIVVIDSEVPGASQPYHYAAELQAPDYKKYLADCGALAESMALAAVADTIRELTGRQYRVAASAILMAAGRDLPLLPQILASHPLIHTAEGQFFRDAVRKACERLKIPVTAIRERDLAKHAQEICGAAAGRAQRRIAQLGSFLGPPWTADHKAAALAAWLALEGG
jgi:hypothetical protein